MGRLGGKCSHFKCYPCCSGCFLMASFWVTEALPIPATSLLPLVLFPVLGIAPVQHVAPAFSDKFILLLMGGFFVALGLERWNLHKRLALRIIVAVGTQPSRLVLGFMLAGAGLSMWISNTATTLMMLPIALAVLQRVEERAGPEASKTLGIALRWVLHVQHRRSRDAHRYSTESYLYVAIRCEFSLGSSYLLFGLDADRFAHRRRNDWRYLVGPGAWSEPCR